MLGTEIIFGAELVYDQHFELDKSQNNKLNSEQIKSQITKQRCLCLEGELVTEPY